MTGTAIPTVLQVAAPARYGGLERVLAMLAGGLLARGRRVHVLMFLDVGQAPHPLVEELRSQRVPATVVEVPARAYGVERAHLRRVASEIGAGVVHTHGARVDVVDAPAARRMGLRTVCTLHGFTGGSWKNRLYEWLQVRAVARGDAVVAVSEPMASRLRDAGVPTDRLHVIRNAWSARTAPLFRAEARAALGLPADGFRIGWVGRLTPEKGTDVLVRALALLEDASVAASVLGGGREEGALRDLAESAGLGARITWHGVVPDADRLMAAFDVFVLSSRTEGTPMALFEAMAAGVPVVTTAVGGVPDIVTPREAVLVPPDDPAALAAGLRTVMSDRAGARTRAQAASERLTAHFGVDAWLASYEHVYARAVAAGARGGR